MHPSNFSIPERALGVAVEYGVGGTLRGLGMMLVPAPSSMSTHRTHTGSSRNEGRYGCMCVEKGSQNQSARLQSTFLLYRAGGECSIK